MATDPNNSVSSSARQLNASEKKSARTFFSEKKSAQQQQQATCHTQKFQQCHDHIFMDLSSLYTLKSL
jgi:hypothetical protein